MKVDLKRITSDPLILEDKIDVKDWDVDRFDVKFTAPVDVKAEFTKAGKEIIVNVEVVVTLLLVCSRCGTEVSKQKKEDFMLSYNSTEIIDYIEIDEDIREQLLLDMPLKVLCKEDCKGLCANCGQDLNESDCSC